MRWPELIHESYPPKSWADLNIVVVEWMEYARRDGRTAPVAAKLKRLRAGLYELMLAARPVEGSSSVSRQITPAGYRLGRFGRFEV